MDSSIVSEVRPKPESLLLLIVNSGWFNASLLSQSFLSPDDEGSRLILSQRATKRHSCVYGKQQKRIHIQECATL